MKKIYFFIFIFLFFQIKIFSGDLIDFVITISGASYQAGVTITGVNITAMDYETSGDGPIKQDFNGYVTITASVGICKVISTGTNITPNFVNGQWTGDIVFYGAANPLTITCIDASGATGIAYKTINPGPYSRLIYLIKGMEHKPGTLTGYSGAPEPNYLVTYLPFSVTVIACDSYYNKVKNFPGVSSSAVRLYTYSVQSSISPTYKDIREPDANGEYVFNATIMPVPDESKNYSIMVEDVANTWVAKFSLLLYFISQNVYYMWAEINGIGVPLTQTAFVKAGVPFDVTIKVAHDLGGNTIGGFNELVQIKAIRVPSGEDALPVYSGFIPIQNGIGYISISYTVREKLKILPVYENKYQGLYYVTKVASGPIEILAAEPNSFILSVDKNKLRKGETATINVLVKDVYSNPVSQTAVDFAIKQGAGTLSATTVFTDYYGNAKVIYTAPDANYENIIEASVIINSLPQTQEIKILSSKTTTEKNIIKNYPNPFIAGKESTQIEYYLENDSEVEIKIFNLYGNVLWFKKIEKGKEGARQGGNTIYWDGKTEKGYIVGSGLYILKIKVKNENETYTIERKIAVKK